MIPNCKIFTKYQKNSFIILGISGYKRRNYNNNFVYKQSRKFNFLPEFLEIFDLKKKKREITPQKNFNNFSEKFYRITSFFFFIKFFLNFISTVKVKNQFCLFFFWEKHISIFITYILIYLSFSLLFQKITCSRFYDSVTISFIFFWIIKKVEFFFFFNGKILISLMMSLICFFGVYFSLWGEVSIKKDILLSYSVKTLKYRETIILITSLSLFNIIKNTKILLCKFTSNFKNFPSFFLDFSTFLTLERCFFFPRNYLKFKSGGNLILIFSILYLLFCLTFSHRTPFNQFYFIFKKFWAFENFSYSNSVNFEKSLQTEKSLLLISVEKNFNVSQKNFEEEYFNNNFSEINSSKRWKIKKAGIIVPFPFSIWQSELPFKKKSLRWNIKNKDI